MKGLYRTAKHREFFERLKKQFRESGYVFTEQLINSNRVLVHLKTETRIILIGFHKNVMQQIGVEANEDGIITNFDWEKNKSFSRDVFKLNWPKTSPYQENVPTKMPEAVIKELTIQYWWEKNDVEHHPNNGMFFKPRAGLYRFQSKDEGDAAKKSYKRLHRWRYSPTAAYGNNEVHIHPYKPRRISVAESLAIQSLPKEYVIPSDVSLSDAFKTIGNGVPFLAANGIAKNIYDYIHRK